MNALTTIDQDAIRIAFPELDAALRTRVEAHLRRLLARDIGPRTKTKPGKSRAEAEAAIPGLVENCLSLSRIGLSIEFQRTLRIPDDDKSYPLPPGLGRFPLRHVEDFAQAVPSSWNERGGAMLPLHQSEALWLNFSGGYPVALKIAAGKICAVSGEEWQPELRRKPQNYCVVPGQPWLDGYSVKRGMIRQFVAEPLGEGFTVEEQLTGKGEWGGIQLQARPLDPEIYWENTLQAEVEAIWGTWLRPPQGLNHLARSGEFFEETFGSYDCAMCCDGGPEMGLAAGGRMKQDIYRDDHKPEDYLPCSGNRCFVHLCNSAQWELITGDPPPGQPPTARDYSRHGLPWFDYYDEKRKPLPGGKKLKDIKSVKEIEEETGNKVLPAEPDEAKPKVIVKYIKE